MTLASWPPDKLLHRTPRAKVLILKVSRGADELEAVWQNYKPEPLTDDR